MLPRESTHESKSETPTQSVWTKINGYYGNSYGKYYINKNSKNEDTSYYVDRYRLDNEKIFIGVNLETESAYILYIAKNAWNKLHKKCQQLNIPAYESYEFACNGAILETRNKQMLIDFVRIIGSCSLINEKLQNEIISAVPLLKDKEYKSDANQDSNNSISLRPKM